VQPTSQCQVPLDHLFLGDQIAFPLLQPQFRFPDLQGLQLLLTVELGRRLQRILVSIVTNDPDLQWYRTVDVEPQEAVAFDVGDLHLGHGQEIGEFAPA
jgi:hypothetical protein